VLLDAGSIPAASTINKTPPQGGFLLMVLFVTRTRAMQGEGRIEICMHAVAVKDSRSHASCWSAFGLTSLSIPASAPGTALRLFAVAALRLLSTLAERTAPAGANR